MNAISTTGLVVLMINTNCKSTVGRSLGRSCNGRVTRENTDNIRRTQNEAEGLQKFKLFAVLFAITRETW